MGKGVTEGKGGGGGGGKGGGEEGEEERRGGGEGGRRERWRRRTWWRRGRRRGRRWGRRTKCGGAAPLIIAVTVNAGALCFGDIKAAIRGAKSSSTNFSSKVAKSSSGIDSIFN